jgi:hypothetical protein
MRSRCLHQEVIGMNLEDEIDRSIIFTIMIRAVNMNMSV